MYKCFICLVSNFQYLFLNIYFLLHLFKCFHLILIHFKTIPKENCFHSTIFGKQATKKQKILFLKKIVLIKLKINRIYVQ